MSGPASALFERKPADHEAAWLARLRGDARKRFEAAGVPSPNVESWRQTNVRPLASIPFGPADEVRLGRTALDGEPLAGISPRRIVLVNGRFDAALSTEDFDLARKLADAPASVEPFLGRVVPEDGHPFAALNTACFADGAAITIPPGVVLDRPIHVLHVITPHDRPVAVAPRTLIVAGAGSRAAIVETFLSRGDAPAFTNAVTEIVLEEDAQIDHVKVQSEGEQTWHVANVAARVARDGRLASHNLSWGAKLARNDIGAVLDGAGASCHLYGLYLADGEQHVDNHTWLDHAKAHCPSWEMYKGVLAGRAKAVFNGRIIVREGAQKTDAKQSNKNLLLSDGAAVSTRPQLEIYANDVRCTHGATIGRLDETALFYLRSRGLGAAQARDLLVHAFVDDVLAKIPDEAVRRAAGAALYARLAPSLSG